MAGKILRDGKGEVERSEKAEDQIRVVVTQERICRIVTHGANILKRLKSMGDKEVKLVIASTVAYGSSHVIFLNFCHFSEFLKSVFLTHRVHCTNMLWVPFQLLTR